jgi:hypothetical protein
MKKLFTLLIASAIGSVVTLGVYTQISKKNNSTPIEHPKEVPFVKTVNYPPTLSGGTNIDFTKAAEENSTCCCTREKHDDEQGLYFF